MGLSHKDVLVKKASGAIVPFSRDKIRSSLTRSGAASNVIDEVIQRLEQDLYDHITTQELYRKAYKILRQISKSSAARYKLKQAIMELGPSGYPFEKYVAAILKAQGYSVEVGKIVSGKCVNHEIDVVAQKGDYYFMVECKYHNQPGTMSDVKIPLYIHSRFKDIEEQWSALPEHNIKFHQGWLVTNTKFTLDAVTYGNCAGLKLISWDYPSKENLKETIDKLGLYPITCLTSLTQSEKRALLDKKVVLCAELNVNRDLLETIVASPSRIKAVVTEATQLCQWIKT